MVWATRQNISSGVSVGVPASSFLRYRLASTMRAFSLSSARGRSAGASGETGVEVVAGFMDRVLSAVLWKTGKTASGERLFACGKFGGGVPRVGEVQAKA